LNILERKIDLAHPDLVNEGKGVTTEMLKNRYLGVEEKPHNLRCFSGS
jgi:hypothetical protein